MSSSIQSLMSAAGLVLPESVTARVALTSPGFAYRTKGAPTGSGLGDPSDEKSYLRGITVGLQATSGLFNGWRASNLRWKGAALMVWFSPPGGRFDWKDQIPQVVRALQKVLGPGSQVEGETSRLTGTQASEAED